MQVYRDPLDLEKWKEKNVWVMIMTRVHELLIMIIANTQ